MMLLGGHDCINTEQRREFTHLQQFLRKVNKWIEFFFSRPHKGTVPTPQKKLFYYWSDRNENLWTHVKSKKGWGNFHVIFPVFFIENELFKENWKKRESAVNRPAVELL